MDSLQESSDVIVRFVSKPWNMNWMGKNFSRYVIEILVLSFVQNSIKANAELNVEKGLPDSNTSSSTLLLDTTDEHRIHLFDLNCRICTGKMAPPGEPPRRETPSPLVSTTSM